ncbi:calmodulin-binding transcription activator 3-like isoform X2 [Cornus florida]|uniref:calmodulin-binding transcription activator 3-like isoform X2 n=1 Tax=Cornus florida TaxID=4283 RepID=UPI00289A0812|nr:calmodulin-binding transcription activator 3-like isoform X2 [Cornus florida]
MPSQSFIINDIWCTAYNHQASSTFHSFLELQQPAMKKIDDGLSVPYYPMPPSNDDYQRKLPPGMDFSSVTQGDKDKNSIPAGSAYDPRKHLDYSLWDDELENYTAEVQSVSFQPSLSSAQSDSMSVTPGQGNEIMGQVFADGFARKQDFGSHPCGQEEGQTSERDSSRMSKWPMDRKLHPDLAYNLTARFPEEVNHAGLLNSLEPYHPYPADQNKHPMQNDLKIQPTNVVGGSSLKAELGNNLPVEGKADYSVLRPPLLDGFLKEGLKKLDSFDRWMSKELEDVNDSHMQSSSGTYWETVGSEDGVDVSNISSQAHLDPYMLAPSLSQDQLYSIIDFSPNWAYAGSEIKVLITGRFLKSQRDVEKCKWSCMFGELEVPAEVIADGVLRCHTPLHQAGRIPFYVTCSNRLACSEVREFEYRENNILDVDVADTDSCSTTEILLRMRFGKLLSVGSLSAPTSGSSNVDENSYLCSKISSSMENDDFEWDQMLKLTAEDEWSPVKIKEQLLQKLLKEKLHVWLLQKSAEGGKGPCILDEKGQGVLHYAAALGYDWAIQPTIAAGVSINFRDVNGWTALHWAASWGRERTVVLLISSGAAPGLVTDPTPEYPSGRTPADLASSKGHKGIAGFLAESALSFQLSSLELKDTEERDAGDILGTKVVRTVSERTATPISDGDLPYGLSLKDSLAAVCNATQAAARIHQVFRVQSFQKKQLKEYGDKKFGMSDERALSFVAVKTSRLGQHDGPVQAAAIRIQNKFRSWKGRKEFLTIRQQIVKIQAHVRGFQVRKNYKKIIWSVGIVEKVILRWRRKGSGLRGFKSEALPGGGMQHTSSKEDDYDFLKEGRKQTEERLQKALARVKSMVQYPEARDQYRRLLTVVTEMQETKNVYNGALTSSEDTGDFEEDLIDIEALLEDDFMSSALD